MSTERFAVFTVVPRGDGKKPFWLRIGTMWPNSKGGFRIAFDALPLHDGGKVVIIPDEPLEDREHGGGQQRRGNGGQQAPQQRRAAPPAQRQQDDFDYSQGGGRRDDEIPF